VLSDSITDIRLPFGQRSPAAATQNVSIGGNLRADAPDGEVRQSAITVFDAQGNPHELTITFTKNGDNTWDYAVDVLDPGGVSVATGSGTVTFDASGNLATPATAPTINVAGTDITLDFGEPGSISGLSQFASASTAVAREQDGYTSGDLERISISPTGEITGAFTNGVTLTLGQIALADFNNPGGLIRTGDNMYSVSPNSGAPVLGFAGEGSQSHIISGALEMSNVDLAQEFTNMITAQRGFQSNARVISTSDEMLQELVNLSR